MRPIYSNGVHINLSLVQRGTWMLTFFDVNGGELVAYICSSEELLQLDDMIRETVIKYVKEMDFENTGD